MALRILTDNRADSAIVTVDQAAPGLGPENLKSDLRGDFLRILGGSAQFVATWAEPVPIGAVVLTQTTLGPSSKIRVRLYGGPSAEELVWDSSEQWAAPGTITDNEDWTENLNTNTSRAFTGNDFTYSVAPSAAVYLKDQLMAKKVVIDLEDPSSEFIDIARLLIGPYFQPKIGASYGQSSSILDMSTYSRSASGTLRAEIGPIARTLDFSLTNISTEDRGRVQRLLTANVGRSVWVSLCADSADKELERDKSLYGKLTQPTALQWVSWGQHSADFKLEGL